MPITIKLTEKGKEYIEKMKREHGVAFFYKKALFEEAIKKLLEMPEEERNKMIEGLLFKDDDVEHIK